MGKEIKKPKEEKKPKKGYFTESEWAEIQDAMKEEGYKSFSDYTLNMVRSRRERTDAEQRRKQIFNYHHARIHTLHNMLMTNIEPRKAIDEIMMEVDKLCRELV